jgi:hypothetical protein
LNHVQTSVILSDPEEVRDRHSEHMAQQQPNLSGVTDDHDIAG